MTEAMCSHTNTQNIRHKSTQPREQPQNRTLTQGQDKQREPYFNELHGLKRTTQVHLGHVRIHFC